MTIATAAPSVQDVFDVLDPAFAHAPHRSGRPRPRRHAARDRSRPRPPHM